MNDHKPQRDGNDEEIRPRERDAIVQSLRAGLTPRRGLHHIQVGRSDEVSALIDDLDRIQDGGSAIRFVAGEHGSGKTFFLNLVRNVALERRLVTMHADLATDRRLYDSGGRARALYRELVHNLSTRGNPDGGALENVVQRFVATARSEADGAEDSPADVIEDRLEALTELVGGYAFADVVGRYWEGFREGDPALENAALRWLRGEYGTKTEARKDLGVRTVVDDSNVYEMLKIWARFVRLAGYEGLLVNVDELKHLFKITQPTSREYNYEKILAIVNDGLQGSASGIGFLFAATPDVLEDRQRGLYSHDALRDRLSGTSFGGDDAVDLTGPVLHLPTLTEEDMYLLLHKLRHVYAAGDPDDYLVPDEALQAFMERQYDRVGARYYQTPRETIKEFLGFLAHLDQHPDRTWEEVLDVEDEAEDDDSEDDGEDDDSGDEDEAEDDDDLETFRL